MKVFGHRIQRDPKSGIAHDHKDDGLGCTQDYVIDELEFVTLPCDSCVPLPLVPNNA